MLLLGKPLSEIKPEDIVRLIDNKVPEDNKIEYKGRLPEFEKREGKIEFLADVSAFANKAGGTIIFGIEEEKTADGKHTGLPVRISDIGIDKPRQDELKRQMESIIRDGLQPPLSNIDIRFQEVQGKRILMLGIPRSLFAPHMISFEKNGRFHLRNNGGKCQMGIDELRQAFLEAYEWLEKAKKFRMGRIEEIRAIKGSGTEVPYVLLHIIPLGGHRESLDLKENIANMDKLFVNEYLRMVWQTRFNVHGYVGYSNYPGGLECVQLYRDGTFEIVKKLWHFPYNKKGSDSIEMISGRLLETMIESYMNKYIEFTTTAMIEPPLAVFVTLLNVRSYSITSYEPEGVCINTDPMDIKEKKFLDHDVVLLDSILIESVSTSIDDITKPLFDMLWQASGWDGSPFVAQRGQDTKI